MSGSATFTIVTSSRSMKTPVQKGGQRQRVGVDDPLEVRQAGAERLLNVWERDVHDRDVEQEHEDAGAEGRPATARRRRRPTGGPTGWRRATSECLGARR